MIHFFGKIQLWKDQVTSPKLLPPGSVVSQEESLQFTDVTNPLAVTPAYDPTSLQFDHDLSMESIMQGLMNVKETPSKSPW